MIARIIRRVGAVAAAALIAGAGFSAVTPTVQAEPTAVESSASCVTASAANAAVRSLPQPHQIAWTLTTTSPVRAGGCALSYAVASPVVRFADSPVAILLFTPAGFAKTATAVALPFTTVIGSTPNSVTVQYRWLTGAGDSAALPGGGPTQVTYTATDSGIATSGVLPPAAR